MWRFTHGFLETNLPGNGLCAMAEERRKKETNEWRALKNKLQKKALCEKSKHPVKHAILQRKISLLVEKLFSFLYYAHHVRIENITDKYYCIV